MSSSPASVIPNPHSAKALSSARRATRAQFAALGTLAGTWGAHVPSVKLHYVLGEAMLSTVLLAAAVGAVASLFAAGRIVARLGARKTAMVAACVMCAVLGVVLVLPNLAVLLPLMMLFGAAMSVFDVAINTEGSELETLSGRAIMSNLHGMFSVGGMVGAGVASVLLRAGIAPALQLALVCAAVAAFAVVSARGMLDTHVAQAADASEKAHFAWPRGLLLVLGLLIFAGMTAEGVMYDWSVLYLKQDIGMPQAQAALGYATFAAAMALARFGGDALRARYSERALLGAGAALSATAMAVVLLSANAWIALVGFALVGAGLAPVAPILFNAATRVPGVSRAAAIASVTSIGYSGFMVGPPLIGGIAQNSSLTAALGVVVLAAVMLALGARYVPDKA
jgi:predicted MFS family arabinose efflux permease